MFALQAKGLSNPPDVIISWVKCGHLTLKRPEHMQPNVFANVFWHWWASMNPLGLTCLLVICFPKLRATISKWTSYILLERTDGYPFSFLCSSGKNGLVTGIRMTGLQPL